MAVQNHDAALSEKEQLELMLQKSKIALSNLQDRVRQLETVAIFQLAAESRGPRAEPRRVWSYDELLLVRLSFEKSHQEILDLKSCSSVPVAHSIDQETLPGQKHDSASQLHATALIHQSTFGADYFCTWLTTDAHAKNFKVTYRMQAIECGAALLTHKVIVALSLISLSMHQYCVSIPSHQPLQIMERVPDFQFMADIASSLHIPSEYLDSTFEDNHMLKYRFTREEHSSNRVQVV